MPAPPSAFGRVDRLRVGAGPFGFGEIALRDARRFAAMGSLIDFDVVAMSRLSGLGLNEVRLQQ
jgi:hypothetical protein